MTLLTMADKTGKKDSFPDRQDVEALGRSLEATKSVGDDHSKARQFLLIGTMCAAMFNNQIGLNNTIAIVGTVGESFGISDTGQLSWFISGFSLTVGTFILIGGRLGDRFGHKRLFLYGMTWYSICSLIAGLSVYASHVLFIFARVFQGIGPAMILPNSLGILGRTYSGTRRNMAFAWFGAAAPFGAIAGFLAGGGFALLWWPWIYWSQAIALLCMVPVGLWVIPPDEHDRSPSNSTESVEAGSETHGKRTLVRLNDELDLLGMATGVATLVLFNFTWNQAVLVGWNEPYIYVCLILALFVLGLYLWIERRAMEPILPIAIFNENIAFVFACTATGWACFGIWIFYVSQVAINIGHNTPLQMAAWFIPVIPVGLTSALLVGKWLGRIPASWIMIVGQVAYVTGSVLCTLRPPNSIYWTYFFCGVSIITVGMDTSFPASAMLFSAAVPVQYQGMAASIVLTIVNYSISLALGFAGTIENYVNDGGHNSDELLHGYHAAQWFGVGLAGLGLMLSLVFEFRRRSKLSRGS